MVVKIRLDKAEALMESKGIDSLIITYEPNVFYFTAVPRPGGTYLFLLKDEKYILSPALDFWRVSEYVRDVEVIPYSGYDIPGVDVKRIARKLTDWIVQKIKEEKVNRLGIDLGSGSPYALRVKERLSDLEVIDVASDIVDMRVIKDSSELSLLREALRITESSLTRVVEDIRPGLREYEIAGMLEGLMRTNGADGYAFETIVASGRNAAFPHAVPTKKTVVEGDPIVIDMGARYGGYCADMTRTPVIGEPEKELKKIIEAVDEAVNTATDLVAPGVKVSEVDAAARDVLRKNGYGKYFIHSLGHGVGIEVHEKPRVAQGVDEVLKEGMVITIEPGVYIYGKYGVRIENMVVVTKEGHEVLNSVPNII